MDNNKKKNIIGKVVKQFGVKAPASELEKGVEEEKEHTTGQTKVINPTHVNLSKVALAHLKNDPKYYTHLSAMEKKYGKKEMK
jgi:hypothetical protein